MYIYMFVKAIDVCSGSSKVKYLDDVQMVVAESASSRPAVT